MSFALTGSPAPPRYPEDLEIAHLALDGDAEAVEKVQQIVTDPSLRGSLIKRGASDGEAKELVGDLLADCFGGEKKRGGLHRLLEHFNGNCSLLGYLIRVGVNRLIDLKRRQKKTSSIEEDANDQDGDSPSQGADRFAGPEESPREEAVLELLRSALLESLAGVDPERLVLLRLRYIYSVPQTKISEMWGWHNSKVSRALSSLVEEIGEGAIAAVRARDPELEIEWKDFLDLCVETNSLFA